MTDTGIDCEADYRLTLRLLLVAATIYGNSSLSIGDLDQQSVRIERTPTARLVFGLPLTGLVSTVTTGTAHALRLLGGRPVELRF